MRRGHKIKDHDDINMSLKLENDSKITNRKDYIMSTSAKGKKKVDLDEFMEQATQSSRRRSSKADAKEAVEEAPVNARFANIEENTVYKIMFAEGDPEAKRDEVASFLAYDKEKPRADNKAALQEFEVFKEWMMLQRKEMAQEIISMTDTETFAELKGVIDDFNNSMIDFDEQMEPLMEILDAVYALRMASDGAMFDVFEEIRNDKAREEELVATQEEQAAKLETLEGDITALQSDTRFHQNQRGFLGWGGVKSESQRAIADNEVALERKREVIQALKGEIEETSKQVTEPSKYADLAHEKEKLRELLDITSGEHTQRQEQLVAAAQNIITTSEDRSSSVLDRLRTLNGSIDNMSNANGGMRSVYAIMKEAVDHAEVKNKAVLDEVSAKPEGESTIQEMKRTEVQTDVENHATSLTAAKVDTAGTYADLTAESFRIKSMKDANNQQVQKMQTLHTKGVAGVASQLSTVLNGVAAASLTESSEVASSTLERIRQNTNNYSMRESMRNALGIQDQNDDLVKAIEELEKYGQVARETTSITREGLKDMKANIADLQKTAQDVGDAVRESIGANAAIMYGDDEPEQAAKKAAPEAKKPGGPSVFDKV
jgi:hypothetical protein